MQKCIHTYIQTGRHNKDSPTCRNTGADTHTESLAYRDNIQAYIQTAREACIQTYRQAYRDRQAETGRE